MSKLKIGSLFSGYGGLDLAVMEMLDAEVAWHCEFDSAPSKILEHHFPNIPNYGDITKIDFNAIEQVDILTGGFPCQDLSFAGKRAGLEDGTRSGLWSEFVRAIETIKPRLVVIENVRGLLTARTSSNVEYSPEVLAVYGERSVLTAMQAVCGNLSDLGYDARWCGIKASDANAPHQRFRVFIIAYPSSQSD